MWQFAAGLYLVHLAGGELRLAAIFGFTAGGAIMLFGGIIGNWVDMNRRLKGEWNHWVARAHCKVTVLLVFYLNMLCYLE